MYRTGLCVSTVNVRRLHGSNVTAKQLFGDGRTTSSQINGRASETGINRTGTRSPLNTCNIYEMPSGLIHYTLNLHGYGTRNHLASVRTFALISVLAL